MNDERGPMECYGGPWDGRMVTAREAHHTCFCDRGVYLLVYDYRETPRPEARKVLEWVAAEGERT